MFVIGQGFYNLAKEKLGVGNEKVEELAIQRYATCLQCPYRSSADFCHACGCFLPAKVRSEDKCPNNYW